MDAATIKLAGTPRNAGEIVRLYPQQQEGRIKIYVAATEDTAAPSSTGGWHLVDDSDIATYRMLDRYCSNGGEVDLGLLKLFNEHPAYLAVEYAAVDPESAIKVVLRMVDPRFHVDPDDPDSDKRLRATFGLGGGAVLHASDWIKGSCPRNEDARIATTVFAAWGGPWESLHHSLGWDVRFRCFLTRRMQEHCQDKSQAVALVRTSVMFLQFLRRDWLQGIYQGKPYAPELFVPEHFFANQMEASTWVDFVQRNLAAR